MLTVVSGRFARGTVMERILFLWKATRCNRRPISYSV